MAAVFWKARAKWAADGRGACQNNYSALQEWPSPVHWDDAITAVPEHQTFLPLVTGLDAGQKRSA
jgi:hypothetical protein